MVLLVQPAVVEMLPKFGVAIVSIGRKCESHVLDNTSSVLNIRSEDESACHWVGRTIPQQTLRSRESMLRFAARRVRRSASSRLTD